MISKIVYLILFYKMSLSLFSVTNFSNITNCTITQLHVSAKPTITNAWNLIPTLVSKPRLWQKMKKRNNTSYGAVMYAQKLCASKKSCLTNLITNQGDTIGCNIKCQDSIHLKSNEYYEITKKTIIHFDKICRNQQMNWWWYRWWCKPPEPKLPERSWISANL